MTLLKRYRFQITKAAFGYAVVVSVDKYGLWMPMEVGRYWTFTQDGARRKANRVIRRKRRADAREAATEVVEDQRPPAPARHLFFDRCPHGVQFLNQCNDCPGGWQPKSESDSNPSSSG